MSATNPHVPPSEAPDHAIIGEVRTALGESPDVNIQNLVVDSVNGLVRLAGIVGTLRERQAAGKIAAGIVGARRVENNLSIALDKRTLDTDIYEAVEEALGSFPGVEPRSAGVRVVEDGIVYLAGQVPSLEDARGAEEIVVGIKGVTRIVNEIEIAYGAPVDDIALGNLVMDALSDDPRIDPFSIEAHSQDGKVLIEGEVEDEEAKQAASQSASAVPGVKKVINHLKVRQAAG